MRSTPSGDRPVPVQVMCGTRYQEDAGGTSVFCACGMGAVARCTDCSRPLCGADTHRGDDGNVRCENCLNQLRQAVIDSGVARLEAVYSRIRAATDPVERWLVTAASFAYEPWPSSMDMVWPEGTRHAVHACCPEIPVPDTSGLAGHAAIPFPAAPILEWFSRRVSQVPTAPDCQVADAEYRKPLLGKPRWVIGTGVPGWALGSAYRLGTYTLNAHDNGINRYGLVLTIDSRLEVVGGPPRGLYEGRNVPFPTVSPRVAPRSGHTRSGQARSVGALDLVNLSVLARIAGVPPVPMDER
jgi:hypothetical protein